LTTRIVATRITDDTRAGIAPSSHASHVLASIIVPVVDDGRTSGRQRAS
jgi:hypothetical protein